MALTITGTLIIDETSGTQNATAGGSDSTGNDVAAGLGFLNTGVSAFDTLLAAVVTQDLTGINVTVSVSNGTSADTDGSSMLSGFGTDVTDLAFTNSTGGPLLGEAALSAPGVFLLTADGHKIYLYSYTGADLGIDENNVVFGRKANADGSANATGDVVFAAYLQPTDASGAVQATDLNAVGSKVWLVQYEEIKHPITTNHDDALSLYNLHVSVSNRSDFSLQGAPSGQHLFLMYGDGTPSATDAVIIVTGKNPINQSEPNAPAITSGDTVNTGKGGGPTTLGTNSQQIVEGTGLYFTFAKGANPNFTVNADHTATSLGFLDQGEADVEANIDFTSLYGSNGASFSVVQSASGDQSTLEISAYTTPFNPGIAFIDNLHNNTAVAVTKVTITTQPSGHGKNAVAGETLVFDKGVIGTTPTTLSGITVTFSANTVVIKGLEADDLIFYNTDGLHTRVLIDNIGSTDTNFDAPFDIGGFALVNSNITPNQFSALTFQDDGPSVTVSATNEAAVLLTTQDAQTDGDPTDSDSAATTADFSGVFTNTPVYGADGAGLSGTVMSYALSLYGTNGGDSLLDSNGVQINLYNVSGLIVGSTAANAGAITAATTIFSIGVVAATGVVTLTQYAEIDHPIGGDPTPTGTPFEDHRAVLANNLVKLTGTATATDLDGDTATNSADVDLGGNVRFEDDGPSVTVSATNEAAVLLTTQDAETIGAASDSAATTADFSGVFTNTPVYGADGAGTTTMSYVLSLAGAPGGSSGLNSNGVQINLFDDGGVIKGSTAATLAGVNAANTILSIAVVASTGVVTLTQFAEIDHALENPTGSPFDDQFVVLGAGLVNLTGTALTTDGDGDTATDPETIDLGGNVRFADDGPSVTVSATNEAAVLLTTQDAETIGAASDSAATTADFSGVFTNTPVYGADGAGTTTMSYALSLAGAPGGSSGLNSNGVQINLFDDGGVIKGSTAATLAGVNAANTIFSIAVVASTGVVTLTQFAQIDHPVAGDPSPTGSPFEDHLAVLGAGLVNLTGTALTTDGDGDTATDPETIDLGGNVRFADDGPAPLAPADITVANAAGATADAALGYIGKVGADVDGTVKFVGTNGSVLQGMVQDGTPVLENLKIGNLNIYLFGFGTATLTATTDVNNLDASAKVFQMTLNPDGSVAANDLYDITMFQQIENVQVVNFGEIVGVKAGNTDFYLVHNIGGSTVDGLFSAYLNGTPQTVNISTTGVGVANQSIGLGERLQMEFLIDEPSGNPPVSDHLITPAEVESVNHFAFTVTQNNAPADKGDALIRVYAANGDQIQIQEILINGVNVLLAPVLSNEQPNKPSAPRNYVTAVADGLGYKLYGLGGGIGGGNGSDNDTVEIITNTDYARIDIEGIADTDPNTADNDTFDILLLSLAITTPYDLSFAVQANLTDEDGDTSAAQNLDVTLDADGVFPLATLVGVNSFVDPIL